MQQLIARALSVVARSVALSWCCFGVVVLLLYGSVINTVCMVGDRSKNSPIALKDRNPNSGAKHGQTKSTKNNQFYKITHLLCCFPCRVSC